MPEEIEDDEIGEVPELWDELRPGEDFKGPSGSASVMVNGAHQVTVSSAAVSLAWLRSMLKPGDQAQVNFHATGRRGMAGVCQYEMPGSTVGGDVEDHAAWARELADIHKEEAWRPELTDDGPTLADDPTVQLARSMERMTFELLRTNTALVGRVLRTADTAINASDRADSHAHAIEDLTAELAAAREAAEEATARAQEAGAESARLYAEAMRAQARAEAVEAGAEAVADGAAGPGWIDQVVNLVVEKMGPGVIDGIMGGVEVPE
jgi:hypothetical protein